jgi:hypothetical protein
MQMRSFGSLGQVSALTLGGGGIGSVWGTVERAEAVATVRAALVLGVKNRVELEECLAAEAAGALTDDECVRSKRYEARNGGSRFDDLDGALVSPGVEAVAVI